MGYPPSQYDDDPVTIICCTLMFFVVLIGFLLTQQTTRGHLYDPTGTAHVEQPGVYYGENGR